MCCKPRQPAFSALLADQLALGNVHALQTRAVSIRYLKALLADQLAFRCHDVLNKAAGIKCMKALLSDQLATRNVHALQTRAVRILA